MLSSIAHPIDNTPYGDPEHIVYWFGADEATAPILRPMEVFEKYDAKDVADLYVILVTRGASQAKIVVLLYYIEGTKFNRHLHAHGDFFVCATLVADDCYIHGFTIPNDFLPQVISGLTKSIRRFAVFTNEYLLLYRSFLEANAIAPSESKTLFRGLKHPHIETVLYEGEAIPLITSKSAFVYAYGEMLQFVMRKNPLAAGKDFRNLYEYEDLLPQAKRKDCPDLPNKALTCEQVGHRLAARWARVHSDYFHSLLCKASVQEEARLRAERVARREAEETASAKAKVAEERARVLAEREARKAAPPKPYTQPQPPRLPLKKIRARTLEAEVLHAHHVSEAETQRRREAFHANQQTAIRDKLASNEKQRALSLKRNQEKRGAAQAEREHVVPNPPTLACFLTVD